MKGGVRVSERDLIIHVSVKTVQDIGATVEEVCKQIEAHTGKCTLRIDVFDDEKYGLKVD